MARADFTSTWAKIERAKEHRDILNVGLDKNFVTKRNRPLSIGKYEADAGCHVFRITYVPPNLITLLSDASLVIGDSAANLRSALDHLAYQLALVEARRTRTRLSSGQRQRIYFPIHTSRIGWKNVEATYTQRFGKDNAAIIKSYQPYRGRAGRADSWSGRYLHQLTLLRQLSNRDKHRLLNVVAAVPNRMQTPPLPAWITLGTPIRQRGADSVKLGAETFRLPLVGDAITEVEVPAEVTPTISFPKRGSVIATMDRISAFVVEIVRQFDPLT